MISTSSEFLRFIVEAVDEKVNIKEKLKAYRIFITILLALAGRGSLRTCEYRTDLLCFRI
jgi:hypothetical protein